MKKNKGRGVIVIFIIVKIFKLAKDSRAIQLIKGIIFFILITWISEY